MSNMNSCDLVCWGTFFMSTFGSDKKMVGVEHGVKKKRRGSDHTYVTALGHVFVWSSVCNFMCNCLSLPMAYPFEHNYD